jgi:hypothetical protein
LSSMSEFKFHKMEPEEVFKSLGTSKDGLTTKKAE